MDGDLARLTRRTSALGAYADFITDLIYRICVYVALGLLVGPPPHGQGLVIGLGCVVLALLSRACRLHHEANSPPPPPQAPTSPGPKGVTSVLLALGSGVDHLLPVLILAFGLAGHADWVLGWLVAYSLGDLLVTQVISIPRRS
jgi:phosphatidylglycerophosphate synthase